MSENMELLKLIQQAFPEGLFYNDMAQLCLELFCVDCGLPIDLAKQCTKNNLAETFAKLAGTGFLRGGVELAPLYGASFHEVTDKGHWIEVVASIFKQSNSRDPELGRKLASRLTDR